MVSALHSIRIHLSYIYRYAQKTLGATLLTLEKYIFICSCIYYFLFFLFTIMSIMSIFRGAF